MSQSPEKRRCTLGNEPQNTSAHLNLTDARPCTCLHCGARHSYTILYHFPFQIFDSWRIYFFPPHRKLLKFGPNTRESTILDEAEPDMYLTMTSTIFFYHIIMKLKSRKLLPTWTVAEQKRGLHHPTVSFRAGSPSNGCCFAPFGSP